MGGELSCEGVEKDPIVFRERIARCEGNVVYYTCQGRGLWRRIWDCAIGWDLQDYSGTDFQRVIWPEDEGKLGCFVDLVRAEHADVLAISASKVRWTATVPCREGHGAVIVRRPTHVATFIDR
jgi:hypothetical protein